MQGNGAFNKELATMNPESPLSHILNTPLTRSEWLKPYLAKAQTSL